jgi:hypothetical protein
MASSTLASTPLERATLTKVWRVLCTVRLVTPARRRAVWKAL